MKREYSIKLLALRKDVLLAEEYDPSLKRQLGNSHGCKDHVSPIPYEGF